MHQVLRGPFVCFGCFGVAQFTAKSFLLFQNGRQGLKIPRCGTLLCTAIVQSKATGKTFPAGQSSSLKPEASSFENCHDALSARRAD
jgi:hypothetical protein